MESAIPMKKTWILLLILCGFAMAQRPYNNQRSGYAQNILWRDLHPSTQDSIRAAIIDSITALSADGVTIVNDGGVFKVVAGGIGNTQLAGGILASKLAGSISDDLLNQLTTANKVAGSAVQLGDSTIINDSGLKVGTNILTSAKLKDGAGVGYVDLTQALKDSIAGAGTKNITNNFNGFTNDTTVSFYLGSVDTVQIDISGWSLTTPVVQAISEYYGYYGAVVKSIDANYLVLQAKAYGFSIVYDDSAKITVGVNE